MSRAEESGAHRKKQKKRGKEGLQGGNEKSRLLFLALSQRERKVGG